jgi:N-acylneuraminate cytidylyltransferase
VRARAPKHGVEVRQRVADKPTALADWASARGIRLDRIAYLGNDRGDLPALELVGWPVAVADAIPEVKRLARVVLERAGGQGAVRELADAVVAARAAASPALNTALEGARPM